MNRAAPDVIPITPEQVAMAQASLLRTRNYVEDDMATALSRVYFIQAVSGGPIKIGTSQNPEGRLRQLQSGSPFLLRIVAVVSGGSAVEDRLHKDYGSSRQHGEWFTETNELRLLILALRRELPEQIAFDRDPSWRAVASLAQLVRSGDHHALLPACEWLMRRGSAS